MDNKQKELIRQRVRAELEMLLQTGEVKAELLEEGGHDYVIFHNLETSGGVKGLPLVTDVLVAIPDGYPSALLDMPALPLDSQLVPFVVGGLNPQATISFQGIQWRFLSFHPYSGQGAPNWNPSKHGFHDYYQHLYTWLHKI